LSQVFGSTLTLWGLQIIFHDVIVAVHFLSGTVVLPIEDSNIVLEDHGRGWAAVRAIQN
jgi:hypothetical protein